MRSGNQGGSKRGGLCEWNMDKTLALCPPDFSVRSRVASACNLPQSNCTSLRSGKKSCCLTAAERRGVSAGAPTFCDHALRA